MKKLLIISLLFLIGCGQKVEIGDYLNYINGTFHVLKKQNKTLLLRDMKTGKLEFDLFSNENELRKIDCGIVHEVYEIQKHKVHSHHGHNGDE